MNTRRKHWAAAALLRFAAMVVKSMWLVAILFAAGWIVTSVIMEAIQAIR